VTGEIGPAPNLPHRAVGGLHDAESPAGKIDPNQGSRLDLRARRDLPSPRADLNDLTVGLGAHFMHELPVCSKPYILARGNDLAAPRGDLSRGAKFVVFGLNARTLTLVALPLVQRALGNITVLRRD
jgi:hypothetical protein